MDIFLFQNGGRLVFCYGSKMTSQHVVDYPYLPPCQNWWQYLKRRPSYCDFRFSTWRSPPSSILLDFIFRQPTKSNWWHEAMFKILCRSDLYFRRYRDFDFRKFGLNAYSGPKIGVLGDFTPKHFGLSSRPPNGTSLRRSAYFDA